MGGRKLGSKNRKPRSEESRARTSEIMTGKTHSEAAREKMRIAKLGCIHPPEQVEKYRKSILESWRDPECIERHREGATRGYVQQDRYEEMLLEYVRRVSPESEVIREYPVGNLPGGGSITRIDVADVTRKIAYEADGPHHDYEKDPERDRYLVEQGWSIVHVSYEELDRDG
jgi:hypothetical protein